MKSITFPTQGTCAKFINVSIDDEGLIAGVEFIGGCAGNTAGIAKLVKGMSAKNVIEKLEGTTCGFKNTSCPDQLSKALKEVLK